MEVIGKLKQHPLRSIMISVEDNYFVEGDLVCLQNPVYRVKHVIRDGVAGSHDLYLDPVLVGSTVMLACPNGTEDKELNKLS